MATRAAILLLTLLSANLAAGKLEEHTVPSRSYGHHRRVWVYTPAGYDAGNPTPYPLLLLFDGQDYQEEIPALATLDQLQASGKMPPTVAVLVDNSAARLADLANHRQFADFIGNELIPWARSKWNLTRDPRHSIVGGYSAGGLAAAYIAFRHPELFGKVLAQSGAFWRGNEGANEPWEWLTAQYAAAPRRDTVFYLEVGDQETRRAVGVGPVFIEANRRLRDALRAKGYQVEYVEVPGGNHEPSHWKAQLAPALEFLSR